MGPISPVVWYDVFVLESSDAFTAGEELPLRAGKVGLCATREKQKRAYISRLEKRELFQEMEHGEMKEKSYLMTFARHKFITIPVSYNFAGQLWAHAYIQSVWCTDVPSVQYQTNKSF